MKKTKTIAALFLSLILTACGPSIYKASGLKHSKSSVKTLAILPFIISIEGKRLPKGTSNETIKQFQDSIGYDLQMKAYTAFREAEEGYTVTFLDIDTIDALLKTANISFDNIALQDKAELCKILGADGIISGNATISRPMSDGASVAAGTAVGAATLVLSALTLGSLGLGVWAPAGSTNKITTDLTIHDKSGTLLWKCDNKASGSLFSNTDGMTKGLMEIAAMKFPYTK